MSALADRQTGESKMGFVGVSTAGSSIMKVFPRWAEILELPTRQLVGIDVAMGASPENYRRVVTDLRDDPELLGALVTTHKIAVYEHAHDLFDELDDFAQLCGEISSISKRDGRLIGHAKDPLTARLSMEEFVSGDHFASTGGGVVCLGAGGAGTAATYSLGQRSDQPSMIMCADADAARLAHLRDVHQAADLNPALFAYHLVSGPADSDALVASAPPGSLVINATGLGKDRPGSPLSDPSLFPSSGLVWELNYRGTLEFWHQAQSQLAKRELTVIDGWRYFIHGWSQVVAEVFDLPMETDTVEHLARAAEAVR